MILAIDQGTSSTKTVLFDSESRIVATATASLDISFPEPGFVEQDPLAIYRSVIESVGLCTTRLREQGGTPADIAACGLTNQRETFLLWDRGGVPLSNAVSWQCARSKGICGRLRKEGWEQEISEKTGLLVNPYFSGTKLVWLFENVRDIRKAVRAGSAFFGTVDAWLLYKLTRGAVYASDHTNASRTLFFNIQTLDWDRDLLDRWGLGGLHLPSTHPSQHSYGETDFEGLFSRPIRIGAVIGDSHAAAFGECCFFPGDAKATVGTGSSILMSVGRRRLPAKNGMIATICWSLPDRVEYALEGIIISAGSTVTWIRDQLGLIPASQDSEAMARAAGSSQGTYLIPAFSGVGAPRWNMDTRASIVGLSFASTRETIVRAALESIPYQIADVIGAIQTASGLRPNELRIDGGITANRFVMQFCADLLDMPVVNRGIAEVSALGAATLAGLEAGIYRSLDDIAHLPRNEVRYTAGADSPQAKRDYAGWKAVTAQLS